MPALKTLTVLESERLLDVILAASGTQKKKLNGLRNYTIALLLLDAGLRVGEAVHLLQTDLVVAGLPVDSLCIPAEIAKNKTARIVPLTQRLRTAISGMIRASWIDPSPTASPHAFFQAGKIPPVTTRQVERIIRAAGMVALGRPIHPHILRHTFASRLMRTVNARIVQELLGHKNMSSTQIYTHPNHEDLKKAIATTETEETERNPEKIKL